VLGHEAVEPGLEDDRHQRDANEHRDDRLERGLRQHEQQHRPGDPTEQRRRPEAEHAPALPGQLAPVADGAGHGARDEADRVRHVRSDRRVAEREQDRKG
jgi:hypothetical protein